MLLRNTNSPQVEYIIVTMKKWGKENRVPVQWEPIAFCLEVMRQQKVSGFGCFRSETKPLNFPYFLLTRAKARSPWHAPVSFARVRVHFEGICTNQVFLFVQPTPRRSSPRSSRAGFAFVFLCVTIVARTTVPFQILLGFFCFVMLGTVQTKIAQPYAGNVCLGADSAWLCTFPWNFYEFYELRFIPKR